MSLETIAIAERLCKPCCQTVVCVSVLLCTSERADPQVITVIMPVLILAVPMSGVHIYISILVHPYHSCFESLLYSKCDSVAPIIVLAIGTGYMYMGNQNVLRKFVVKL